jgi:hypothetical protein
LHAVAAAAPGPPQAGNGIALVLLLVQFLSGRRVV